MPLVKRLATFILRVKNKRVVFKVYAFSNRFGDFYIS